MKKGVATGARARARLRDFNYWTALGTLRNARLFAGGTPLYRGDYGVLRLLRASFSFSSPAATFAHESGSLFSTFVLLFRSETAPKSASILKLQD